MWFGSPYPGHQQCFSMALQKKQLSKKRKITYLTIIAAMTIGVAVVLMRGSAPSPSGPIRIEPAVLVTLSSTVPSKTTVGMNDALTTPPTIPSQKSVLASLLQEPRFRALKDQFGEPPKPPRPGKPNPFLEERMAPPTSGTEFRE